MNSIKLDTIQAAILLEKLTIFDEECLKRNELADYYNQKYEGEFITPLVPAGFKSSFAQYTVIANNRESVIEEFKKEGIPTMIYYPVCIHDQQAFSYIKKNHDCPVSEELSKKVLSLPMSSYLI